MAKGLFAVYRDDPAPAGPSGTLARSAAAPPNKASARRKDGATRSEGGLRVSRLGDKENVDPLGGVRAGGQAALVGKAGKKPALGAKRGDDEGRCGAAAGAKKAPRAVAGQRGLSSGGPTNAVCTGTLRTRVLPDLPPLEPEEDVVAAPAASCAAPAIADVVLDDEPDLSSRTSCDTNPLSASTCSSARDSGYARSLRGTGSETDLDVDTAAAFADEDASVEVEVSDGREADRRARALTESPLAEVRPLLPPLSSARRVLTFARAA